MRPNEPWLDLDDEFSNDLQTKAELLRDHRDQVFVEEHASRPAQREVLSRVSETLVDLHADLFSIDGSRLHVRPTNHSHELASETYPPLETAARCVQEDLVVMEERTCGWCLTAAAVCFPTRWNLPSKLGLPMGAIHDRVPGYREQLDVSANRFFDGMKPGSVFRRGNWSLMDDPALFQPEGKLRDDVRSDLDASNAGEKIWLRVEHQTLQRLPETGAVLFGIRIHRTRLDRVAREPTVARLLIEAIDTMPAEMQLYKSLGVVRSATNEYLERVIETGEAESA